MAEGRHRRVQQSSVSRLAEREIHGSRVRTNIPARDQTNGRFFGSGGRKTDIRLPYKSDRDNQAESEFEKRLRDAWKNDLSESGDDVLPQAGYFDKFMQPEGEAINQRVINDPFRADREGLPPGNRLENVIVQNMWYLCYCALADGYLQSKIFRILIYAWYVLTCKENLDKPRGWRYRRWGIRRLIWTPLKYIAREFQYYGMLPMRSNGLIDMPGKAFNHFMRHSDFVLGPFYSFFILDTEHKFGGKYYPSEWIFVGEEVTRGPEGFEMDVNKLGEENETIAGRQVIPIITLMDMDPKCTDKADSDIHIYRNTLYYLGFPKEVIKHEPFPFVVSDGGFFNELAVDRLVSFNGHDLTSDMFYEFMSGLFPEWFERGMTREMSYANVERTRIKKVKSTSYPTNHDQRRGRPFVTRETIDSNGDRKVHKWNADY